MKFIRKLILNPVKMNGVCASSVKLQSHFGVRARRTS
jgi:hypothetical protein